MTFYYHPDAYRSASPPKRPSIDDLARALIWAESDGANHGGTPSDEKLRKARRRIRFWAQRDLLRHGVDGETASHGRGATWAPDSIHRVQRIWQLQREGKSLPAIKETLDDELRPRSDVSQTTAIVPIEANYTQIAPPADDAVSQRVYRITDGVSLVVDNALPNDIAQLVPLLVRTARTICQH